MVAATLLVRLVDAAIDAGSVEPVIVRAIADNAPAERRLEKGAASRRLVEGNSM